MADQPKSTNTETLAAMDETEFLLRGNNRARLEAAIAKFESGDVVRIDTERWERMEALLADVDADDWTDVEGELIPELGVLNVNQIDCRPSESFTAEEVAGMDFSLEDQASPWVLTKTGRIQDLTDEDLEGFEFDTGDMDEGNEWSGDPEGVEEARERIYNFLKDSHARTVAAGGPTQRMKDALALYKRTVVSSAGLHTTPSLADTLKESIQQMKAIERSEAPPLPMRYPAADFDPSASEFVFETDDNEDDDLPTPIASYDAYVLSHRFKDVMAECETGGNLHNLVSSANVEDDHIPYLVEQAETPAEKACIELAAQLSPGERWAAWLIANGREAEARGRGFDAKNMLPMAISDLRAFIDSLDDDGA